VYAACVEVLKFNGESYSIKRRPYKRSLTLSVQLDGTLRLVVPASARPKEMMAFIEKNLPWVEEMKAKFESVRRLHPPQKFLPGEKLPLLGRHYDLHFDFADVSKISIKMVGLAENQIRIRIPQLSEITSEVSQQKIRTAIQAYFKKCGEEIIKLRLELFSRKMELFPSSISFRNQKTRWGSCGPTGKICLNWRLIIAPLEVIDYVVVHELAHLRHADHSKNFWNLVAQHFPDWKTQRRWLSSHHYDFDFLARKSELHGANAPSSVDNSLAFDSEA